MPDCEILKVETGTDTILGWNYLSGGLNPTAPVATKFKHYTAKWPGD